MLTIAVSYYVLIKVIVTRRYEASWDCDGTIVTILKVRVNVERLSF